MSREAMKLALEALEMIAKTEYHIETSPIESLEEKMRHIARKVIPALREALAAPDFWDGYAPEPVKQQALDRMAENARELGLDYEPAQQEPVAWRYLTKYKDQSVWTYCAFEPTSRETLEALYTSPPAQRTWVGLTQEERDHIWGTVGNSDAHGDVDGWSGRDVMSAIEAKLKEKNT